MANAISDIIALGEKLRAAQALADRSDSLEQAIGESAARLGSLRALESDLERRASQARAALNEQQDGAKVQAEAIRRAADRQASDTLETCKRQCSELLQRAHSDCDKLSDEANALRATIASLEDDESRLAQSVTALKAELDALKARVLG